ncbi:MAG: DMT family transporter [Calditrichaeota bacterium]|nr:DMT family transporter [Calditrichota bacterium]
MSWKYWALLATLAWTAWGLAVKFALSRVDWARLEVLTCVAGLAAMAMIMPSAFKVRPSSGDLAGLLAGGFGALGAILFYIALSKGPVSIIVPLTSLYVVGVALFAVLVWGEPVTLRRVLGIVCAVAAIILIAGD